MDDPHQDTSTVLCALSKSVARKREFVSADVVFQRLHSSIALEIWKRSARKIRSCWPLAAFPAPLTAGLRPAPLRPSLPLSVSCASPCWFVSLALCCRAVSPRVRVPARSQRRSSPSRRHLRTRSLVASTLVPPLGRHSRRQTTCSPFYVCVLAPCAQARTDSAWVDLAWRRRLSHRPGSQVLPHDSSGARSPLSQSLRLAGLCSRAPGACGFREHGPRFLTAHASRCARQFAPPVAQLARQDPPDAAEARRSRDKRRRREAQTGQASHVA